MSVHINEVIIRAVVDSPVSSSSAANSCAPPGNTDGSGGGMFSAENEISDLILNIIKEKQER